MKNWSEILRIYLYTSSSIGSRRKGKWFDSASRFSSRLFICRPNILRRIQTRSRIASTSPFYQSAPTVGPFDPASVFVSGQSAYSIPHWKLDGHKSRKKKVEEELVCPFPGDQRAEGNAPRVPRHMYRRRINKQRPGTVVYTVYVDCTKCFDGRRL